MTYKSVYQTFVTKWSKLRTWAADNDIPSSALVPVFNMDFNKMKNTGYTMSESERYRAVLAAAGEDTSTVLPTTVRHPSQVLQNTKDTLWNIFTGIMPTSLAKNIWDTTKNTFLHPMTTIRPLEGVFGSKSSDNAAITRFAQHPTTSLLSFLPLATDLAKLHEGTAGIKTLAEHPVMALLDVGTVSEIAGFGARLAGYDVAAAAEEATGAEAGSLSHDSFLRNAARVIGARDLPYQKLLLKTGIDGTPEYVQSTISDALSTWMRNHHIGKEPSEIMYGALTTGQTYTTHAIDLLHDATELMSKMPDATRTHLMDLLRKSGKSMEELQNTDSIPIDQREVLDAVAPTLNWLQEQALSTGAITKVRMPDGSYEIYSSRLAPTMQSAVGKLQKAESDFYDRKSEADAITNASGTIDTHLKGNITNLTNLRGAVWQYITQSLPHSKDDVDASLRSAVTPEQAATDADQSFRPDRIYRMKTTEDHRFDSPAWRRAVGLDPDEPVYARSTEELTKAHANVINAVFKPGGLIDQLSGDLDRQDWESVRDTANRASRYMERKYAREIYVKTNPQLFDKVREQLATIYALGKDRVQLEKKFQDIYEGVTAKGKKESVTTLLKKYTKAEKEFSKMVMHNPPDAYQPMYLDILTKKLVENSKTESVTDALKSELIKRGTSPEDIEKLGNNPRVMMELLTAFSNSVYEDPLIGDVFPGLIKEVRESAYHELATLRAQGFTANYIPNINERDIPKGGYSTYDIYINTTKVPSQAASFRRTWEFGTSTSNFMLAITKGVKDQLTRDGSKEFLDNYIIPKTYKLSDLEQLLLSDPDFRKQILNVEDASSRQGIMERIFTDTLGLEKWDPNSLFPFSGAKPYPGAEDTMYLDSRTAQVLRQVIDKGQFPMVGKLDKPTNLFRTSILALSPRFTAHVVLGGTYLLGLRINPLTFRYLPEAYRMVRDGTVPDEVLHSVTQEGNESIQIHYMGGRTAARWNMEEWLSNHHIDPSVAKLATWVKAGTNINYRITRFAGNMQRALAFLDGASKVDTLKFITDEDGNRILNDSSRRAYDEGMKSVHKVMGDLRMMSPFERAYMTRIMPFYGWTKHILKYVLSYPVDHPFRAQILASMANTDSQNVAGGLPTRIQFLLFFGKPSLDGTVSGITARFLDPLRTVPNYASLAGYISALNPVITAPLSQISPELLYGTNSLYPTKTYTKAFGIEVGKPESSLSEFFEQWVPQIGGIVSLLKLTKTARQEAKSNPTGLTKQIFEDFNIPFFQVQHLNLKQIAAKAEIDKYEIAKTAATKYFETGTKSYLAGYPSTANLPYPENTIYNVTPKRLEQLYSEAVSSTGMPASDILKYIASPELL